MSAEDKEKMNDSDKVIKETVAEYAVTQVQVLEPWRRSLDSYTDDELDALYVDYAPEAVELAEEGLEEYAQHLNELDKA